MNQTRILSSQIYLAEFRRKNVVYENGNYWTYLINVH